ncbi:MAG: hypothetical protein JSV18_05830 [Candidatus Bathyarchaeota archaeon]|nr:MAG: hypothetical protein JSV18_05830 [Candidatus Bathyarchaeota archaeon]
MNPSTILQEITGKIAPGRAPAYTEAHVLTGLEIIGSGLGVGRLHLSVELRLGEGTVRTMVGRMKDLGLLSTSKGGMKLTQSGRELMGRFNEMLRASELPKTPITVGFKNYAILVKGAAPKVSRGIEQRDAAIISGAQGATTLIYTAGGLRMPGVKESLEPDIERVILDRLEPKAGDVIIIGSSDDPFLSELGAKAAALELLRE